MPSWTIPSFFLVVLPRPFTISQTSPLSPNGSVTSMICLTTSEAIAIAADHHPRAICSGVLASLREGVCPSQDGGCQTSPEAAARSKANSVLQTFSNVCGRFAQVARNRSSPFGRTVSKRIFSVITIISKCSAGAPFLRRDVPSGAGHNATKFNKSFHSGSFKRVLFTVVFLG